MMQLATVANGQPWNCTVYYIFDAQLHLYWCSIPSRRHSQEIKTNDMVAAAIPLQFTNGKKVIGLQIQGTAEQLTSSSELAPLAKQYAKKFHRSERWVEDFCNDRTEHKMYKLTSELFVLFDEENFSDNTRQEFYL